jgi:hypothetical protein
VKTKGEEPTLQNLKEEHAVINRISVITWKDGRITVDGDPKAVLKFKEEWMRMGLSLDYIINLCG